MLYLKLQNFRFKLYIYVISSKGDIQEITKHDKYQGDITSSKSLL